MLESRKSEERALGREIEEWRPKVGNLRNMAEKLVQIFVGQKNDVEPEMEILGQRSAATFATFIIFIIKSPPPLPLYSERPKSEQVWFSDRPKWFSCQIVRKFFSV